MQTPPLRNLFPRFAVCASIGLVSLTLTTQVHAQATWTGATSNAYATGTNWSTGTAPTNSTAVIINTSTPNPTNVSGNWDRSPVGGGGSTTLTGSGIINISGGQARFFSNGLFTMSGGQFNQTGEYFIVGNNGVGTFNQSAGTITTTLTRGFFLSNNNANESGSTYNLSGGTLTVNSPSDGGQSENIRGVYFGKGSAGVGTLVGDLFHATAGTATFTHTNAVESNIRIARNSKLQVSGGTVTFDKYSNLWVGAEAAGSTGNAVIVDGGTLNITGSTNLYLGRQDDGKLTISSGTLNLQGFIILGGDGTGTGGSLMDGIGTVTMTGGNLFASNITKPNAAGSSMFNFSGGTITLQGDKTSVVNQSWWSGAAQANYDSLSNTTVITAVPEPSAYGIAFVAGLGLLVLRRRQVLREGSF